MTNEIETMDLETAVSKSMHRIEECYFETQGKMYISFSGGKDSTVVLAIAKMCYALGSIPELPKAVFSNTGLEMDAQLDFVNWCKSSGWYSNIEIIKPEKSFVSVINDYGKPCVSKLKDGWIDTFKRETTQNKKETSARLLLLLFGKSKKTGKIGHQFILSSRQFNLLHKDFNIKISNKCCDILKKKPFIKYAQDNDILGYCDGEMNAEGGARSANNQLRIQQGGKICTKFKKLGNRQVIIKMPIVDWTKTLEDEFIKKYDIPLSRAYTQYGCDRTGCFLCPYSKCDKDLRERLTILHNYEPKKYKYAIAIMKDVYIARNIQLDFDTEYEKERIEMWDTKYSRMKYEMLKLYRPEKLKDKNYQTNLFEFLMRKEK